MATLGFGGLSRRGTLYVHIFFNTVCFALCFLQFFVMPGTRRGYAKLHRYVGWVYLPACLPSSFLSYRLTG